MIDHTTHYNINVSYLTLRGKKTKTHPNTKFLPISMAGTIIHCWANSTESSKHNYYFTQLFAIILQLLLLLFRR